MRIECPYCKKQINKDSKQCEFCGHEIGEIFAVNYFNDRKEEYDRHRCFLIVVIPFTIACLMIIYYFIKQYTAIRHDDPSFYIPYLVAAGGVIFVTCFILWLYYSFKMKQYQTEIDSMLNESIELCPNCKRRYIVKGEECSCKDLR